MTALQQNARGGATNPATGSSDDYDFVHVNGSHPFIRPARDRQPADTTDERCASSSGTTWHLPTTIMQTVPREFVSHRYRPRSSSHKDCRSNLSLHHRYSGLSQLSHG